MKARMSNLEEKFGGIRDVELGNSSLILARTTLESLFFLLSR